MARRYVVLLPCREAERALWKGRKVFYPMILRYYNAQIPSHPMSAPKGDSHTLSSQHAHPPGVRTSTPTPNQPPLGRHSQEWKKPKKSLKLHYTFYDGTSFVQYPFIWCYSFSPATQLPRTSGLEKPEHLLWLFS